ncbi:hypothetical protein BOVAB4_4519 [Bacteroides ovatus]|nr:hypothetical protein BOVAB4_4519 [Bacteroides ovatus]
MKNIQYDYRDANGMFYYYLNSILEKVYKQYNKWLLSKI